MISFRNNISLRAKREEHEIDVQNSEAVKKLECTWKPNTKPSAAIADFQADRRSRHDERIKQMVAELRTADRQADALIREQAEMYSLVVQECDATMTAILEEQRVFLSPRPAWRRAEALTARRAEEARALRDALRTAERRRAGHAARALSAAAQDLARIAHMTPAQIQAIMEDSLMETNRILMDNMHSSSALTQLLQRATDLAALQFKETLEVIHALTTCQPGDHEARILGRISGARRPSRSLTQLHQNSDVEGLHTLMGFTDSEDHQKLTQQSPKAGSLSTINCIFTPSASEIDACAQRMVALYKNAAKKLFAGYHRKLHCLHQTLEQQNTSGEDDDFMGKMSQLNLLQDDSLITRGINTDDDSQMYWMSLWQHQLAKMTSTLKGTYELLKAAGHLWDAHYLRLAEAQRLVLFASQAAAEDNEDAQLHMEIPVDILVDSIRTAPSVEYAKKGLADVEDLLKSMSVAYKTHRDTECAQIRRFSKLVELELPIICAEIDRFLICYPREAEFISQFHDRLYGPIHEDVPIALMQCEAQITAVINWRIGLLESISRYKNTISDELKKNAQEWIDEKIKLIEDIYKTKEIIHSIRSDRIEKDIYDVRAFEINYHDSRVRGHVKAVEETMTRHLEEYLAKINFDNPEIFQFAEKISSAQETLARDAAKDPLKDQEPLAAAARTARLQSTATRLLTWQKQAVRSIEAATDEVISKMETSVRHSLSTSSMNFISSLRLFSEGGNWSGPEFAEAVDLLRRCAKDVDHQTDVSIAMVMRRRANLISSVQAAFKEIVEAFKARIGRSKK